MLHRLCEAYDIKMPTKTLSFEAFRRSWGIIAAALIRHFRCMILIELLVNCREVYRAFISSDIIANISLVEREHVVVDKYDTAVARRYEVEEMYRRYLLSRSDKETLKSCAALLLRFRRVKRAWLFSRVRSNANIAQDTTVHDVNAPR